MDTKKYSVVDNVEELGQAIARTREAQKVFATYTQEQVDKIFLAAACAANKERIARKFLHHISFPKRHRQNAQKDW